MSLVAVFRRQLSEYLSGTADPCENLVSFEENSNCDFSFVKSVTIWCNYAKTQDQRDLSQCDDVLMISSGKDNESDAREALRRESEKWALKIDKVECNDNRYFIQLHRSSTFTIALETMSRVYHVEKDEGETISIEQDSSDESSISHFRQRTIESVLENLAIHASKYVCVNDSSIAKHKLLLTTRSNCKTNKSDEHRDRVMMNCGVVISDDNKKSQQTADEYVAQRTNDMHLVAIHKYGVRAKDDNKFLKMTESLGKAAAVLDMVEVKCSNTLKINITPKQSFILYNSARLETLLANFNAKVKEGYYGDLKPFGEADAALLTEDLEWKLLKLILEYPEIIHKVTCEIEKGNVHIHLLYKYLYTFMTTFSMFYGKIKVLTENRPQLMPNLHAKIHLLRVVQNYLNQTLKFFNIEPVSFM